MMRRLACLLALCFPFSGLHAASEKLKELAPVAPPPPVSLARTVNERWIEIILPEDPYDPAQVTKAANYAVTSDDDPAFKSSVAPSAVHHRHWPEQARYSDSFDGRGDIASIEVTWRIFLELPRPLAPGKHYRLAVREVLGKARSFRLSPDGGPGTDSEPNESIHVNQIGYRPQDKKVAYLSCWTGQGSADFGDGRPFQLIDLAGGRAVFAGKLHLDVRGEDERWSRSNIYSADFSAFRGPGRYALFVPGVGRSFPFRVDPAIYDSVAYTLLRGLTLQRDGDHGLTAQVTHWVRPPAHLDDAIDERTGERVDLTGGHMDAGDRGKYPYDSANTAASLLTALELYPAQVEALGESLQIPESHNGVPDLVDETAYELDWLAKAVLNVRDGTLPSFLRPASGGYEMGAPPEGQTKRVFFTRTKGPNRAETLFAAGALAMGAKSPLFKKYLPARCAIYRKAALRAFAGYEAHAADPSYWKDIGGYDADAKPHKWSDVMLVAAANLLSLTGEAKYLEFIRAELPPDLRAARRWTWLADVPSLLACVALARATDPRLDPLLIKVAREAIIDFAEASMGHDKRRYEAPFGAPLPWMINQRVGWYFTGSANAWPLMVGYAFTNEQRYLDQIAADWNWLLGTNPQSRSFVSGLGDPAHRPRWLVHELGQVQWTRWRKGDQTGWPEIPPGFLSADVQSGHYSWFLKNAHNAARREEKFPPEDASYPALYRYNDSWTIGDEVTIERLARSAVSVLPLVQLPRKTR